MNVVGHYRLVAAICVELQRGCKVFNRTHLLHAWDRGRGCVAWDRTRRPGGQWLKSFDDFYDGAVWLVSQTREGHGIGVVDG